MPPKRPLSPSPADAARRKKKTPFLLAPQTASPALSRATVVKFPRRELAESEKLSAFPKEVREHIDKQFRLRMSKIGPSEQEIWPPASYKPRYTLNTGAMHLYPEPQRSFAAEGYKYTRADAANTGLLKLILEKEPGLTNGGYEWRELDTTMDIDELKPNPSLFALHALRRGDVGYHFDKHGCLAVCFLREGVTGFDTKETGSEADRMIRLLPRDSSLVCFFVEAVVDDGVPLPEASSLPLAPRGDKKFAFRTIKKEKQEKEAGRDEEDVVARMFMEEKEKAEEAKRKEDDDADAEMEADFGGLEGFY